MTVVGQVHHRLNEPGRHIDFGLLCERPQLLRTTRQRYAELLREIQIQRQLLLVRLNQIRRTARSQRLPRLTEFLAETAQILVERWWRWMFWGHTLIFVHPTHDAWFGVRSQRASRTGLTEWRNQRLARLLLCSQGAELATTHLFRFVEAAKNGLVAGSSTGIKFG